MASSILPLVSRVSWTVDPSFRNPFGAGPCPIHDKALLAAHASMCAAMCRNVADTSARPEILDTTVPPRGGRPEQRVARVRNV